MPKRGKLDSPIAMCVAPPSACGFPVSAATISIQDRFAVRAAGGNHRPVKGLRSFS